MESSRAPLTEQEPGSHHEWHYQVVATPFSRRENRGPGLQGSGDHHQIALWLVVADAGGSVEETRGQTGPRGGVAGEEAEGLWRVGGLLAEDS